MPKSQVQLGNPRKEKTLPGPATHGSGFHSINKPSPITANVD
jgi:hypothetical protein